MKKVLVTGGAGYLGRATLRQVARGSLDWDVTVYSRDETKQDECRRRYPFARYILGDVRDLERLQAAMMGHDWVVHAAALKYIPEAELNASECLSVNLDGARNVVRAALAAGVEKVVGISTDKACSPVNIYGCSKMAMERLFAEQQVWERLGPAFYCVRYGNVVGSTGSVLPLFRRQYEESGSVKVTNPHMTRFWMGVDDAITLVLQALEQAQASSILIPYVKAMTIVDAARAATVDDVPIEIVGERPGEKQHESLLHYEESVRAVRHEDFFELLPPGQAVGEAPFTISSQAPHEWMEIPRMRELLEDAREV